MNVYDPSLAEVATLAAPSGPLSVTVAPGTTAPVSSMICPRNVDVCAERRKDTSSRASRKRDNFILRFCVRPQSVAPQGPDICGFQLKTTPAGERLRNVP